MFLKLLSFPVKILSEILNFFFPQFCEDCKTPLSYEEVLFCKNCLKGLPLIKNYCTRCGNPFFSDLSEYFDETSLNYCSRCLKKPPPYDRVYLGFYYKEPIKTLIQKAKFGENFELSYQLGKLLRKVINLSLESYDLIIPIPLSQKRKRERGFNQSLLMLWGYSGIYFSHNPLKRILHTRPQSELSLKERLSNLKGAFRVEENLKGKRILLFDDVMTSGATLYEASKELKKAGVSEIHLLVLARA